ncbi:sensor domain-containing diguanylate cyclase [Desulfuromonas thiophila]|uniref:sensor domain-containing diguanylate cyclase n=1 Tax=Desulfuromonas thiophila TaxID=57664 RepID=UPI0024A8C65E|nr:sensor domain-containing diguanylate cyclase [Desulfuromonas thiophila]
MGEKTPMVMVLLLLTGLLCPALLCAGDFFQCDVFEGHGAVMLLIDADSGAIVDANQAAALFYGYSRDQLRQLRIQQINSLSDEEVRVERQLAAQEKRHYFLFRHRLADGRIADVEVYSWPIRRSDRTLLFSIVHDVSTRDLALKQLSRSEARLRLAEQVAGQGYWEFDLQRGVYHLSQGAGKLIGLEQEELPFRDFLSLVQVDDRPALEAVRQSVLDGEPSYDVRFRLRRPDGQRVYLRSHGRYDARNNSLFGVIVDVGESTRALQALQQQKSRFARTVLVIMLAQLGVIALLVVLWRRRKQAEQRAQHLALHDSLTGLPNRALFADRVEQALVAAQRNRERVALLFIDLDRFKPVNDQFGHGVGDLLLKQVASRIRACVRESDTAARIGGDEFVVMLPQLHQSDDAQRVAGNIRQALARPFAVAGHALEISASIGIALYPDHGDRQIVLSQRADQAMYQAKQQGRDQVCLYQPVDAPPA